MGISGAMVAEALTRGRACGGGDRPARADPGLDRGDDRAGAVRDRPAADAARAGDRARRGRARLAAVAAGGRESQGADRRAGDPLRPARRGGRSISRATCSSRGSCARRRRARRAAGLHASYLTRRSSRRRTGSTGTGAVVSHDNLALDPRKLTAGLLREALGARGAALCAGGGDGVRAWRRRRRGGDRGRAGDLGRACGAGHRL